MTVSLCVLLWARPGANDALIDYESQVLPLVSDHGGEVVQRVRGSGLDGQPLEVQILRFPSSDALDRYISDDRRLALAGERERAVSRTEIIEVELVEPPV